MITKVARFLQSICRYNLLADSVIFLLAKLIIDTLQNLLNKQNVSSMLTVRQQIRAEYYDINIHIQFGFCQQSLLADSAISPLVFCRENCRCFTKFLFDRFDYLGTYLITWNEVKQIGFLLCMKYFSTTCRP